MKYLLLVLFFISGCDESDRGIKQINPESLHFKAGDKVGVKSGFYASCTGYIVDYHPYVFQQDGYQPIYGINLSCNHMKMTEDTPRIHESNLYMIGTKNGKN